MLPVPLRQTKESLFVSMPLALTKGRFRDIRLASHLSTRGSVQLSSDEWVIFQDQSINSEFSLPNRSTWCPGLLTSLPFSLVAMPEPRISQSGTRWTLSLPLQRSLPAPSSHLQFPTSELLLLKSSLKLYYLLCVKEIYKSRRGGLLSAQYHNECQRQPRQVPKPRSSTCHHPPTIPSYPQIKSRGILCQLIFIPSLRYLVF